LFRGREERKGFSNGEGKGKKNKKGLGTPVIKWKGGEGKRASSFTTKQECKSRGEEGGGGGDQNMEKSCNISVELLF